MIVIESNIDIGRIALLFQAARHKSMLLAMSAVFILPILACDQKTSVQNPAQFEAPTSLRQTYESLRKWYAEGSFASMRPYINAAEREDVIGLLVAVDELLQANRAALEAIKQACPSIQTQQYDMSMLADNLELFSRNIEYVQQRQMGDRGTITVQIADRLPLKNLEFKRAEGHWIYCPGQTGRELIDLCRQITRGLNQIVRAVSNGCETEQEIGNEYRLRVGSKLREIRHLGQPDVNNSTSQP